ncbi:MAG TPA: GH3 auxin-responsive promoter family protein [Bryobacteraceae bacterium]|nr:GH3 auxin-responsive promoter family protein [Bryobacteraceae bacterium]
MKAAIANSLWLAGCLPDYARFQHAARNVRAEQESILRRILAANAGTEFGRSHGFASIRDLAEYPRRVPLRDYDELRPWIDRIAAGASNVLTREPVRLFEPTGGSAGGSKWIPYTASLQREFQRGIRAWMADLFLHDPALLDGRAYWSVSPAGAPGGRTSGGVPIGFEDDTHYVGGWQRRLARAVMAVPAEVRLIPDMDEFRYATLLHLCRARDLKLISVWNPAFLSLLMERLTEWRDRLAHDLPGRAAELRSGEPLWPSLRLISCWTDANAAGPAAALAAMFPRARIQGKGLIATEGFVSFPLAGYQHCALAVRSHFLEFLPEGSEIPLMAHELDAGQRYRVVMTTGGGLYRYKLGDIVEVTGFVESCPLVRFLGRSGYISDWFGEKLNEAHVSRVMQDCFTGLGMTPRFAMLACEPETPAAYVLYIDTPGPDEVVERAAARIDEGLRENFHYSYARHLGQLEAVRVFRADAASEAYFGAGVQGGRRAGDIKPRALDCGSGWRRVFEGDPARGRISSRLV